jgi:succinyl-diaminopimelate desuccinylase
VRLARTTEQWAGSVVLLFGIDEHTGVFCGAKVYFDGAAADRVDGVMIGYPGLEHVVTGG